MGSMGKDVVSKFVVCKMSNDHPRRLFAALDDIADYVSMISTMPAEEQCFFEVIFGERPQKLYYDIDMDGSVPQDVAHTLLKLLIDRIVAALAIHDHTVHVAEDVLLFSSCSSAKRSYHIILDGFCVAGSRENKALASLVLDRIPDEYKKYIDQSMYSSIQQLRLPLSQKPGSGRPKLYVKSWRYGGQEIQRQEPPILELFRRACVTYTKGCKLVQVDVQPLPRPKTRHGVEDKILQAIQDRADKVLFKVFRIDKVVDENLVLLRRQTRAYCSLCQRVHDHENAFLVVHESGDVVFYCRRDMSKKKTVANVADLMPANALDKVHLQSAYSVYARLCDQAMV